MQTYAVSSASTAARSLPPEGDTYTVQRGDTLSDIADRNGVSLSQLLAANPQIRNANVIDVGDKINLPAAQRSYTVQPGDTLSDIAAAHGTTWQELAAANNIDNPNRIDPGDVLRIPGAGGVSGSGGAPATPGQPSKPPTTPPTTTPGAGSGAQVKPGQLPTTSGLSEAQRYDLYAGYINQFGSAGAKQDLADGKKVALSLRVDTNTNANQGNGVYDDRLVLVWQDAGGKKHIQEFKANTDPSGQYEPGGQYTRKPVGSNYGGDSRGDQGRLADGTYAYTRGTFLGAAAMLSSADQVTQRDTNHDGKFNDGVSTAKSDYGMHIHIGGQNNTYSAGCFTLAPGEHGRFFDTLGGQNSLRNVVVNTTRLPASAAPGAAPTGDTPPATTPPVTAPSGSRTLTEADWQRAATSLGVDVAAIKAVANVEAPGSGFLPDGRPKILFEAAQFGRLTGDRYNSSHPNISSAKWDRSLYVGGAGEYKRLEEAKGLNETAALQAASWGRFQIMGFNHKTAGYSNVQDFVKAMQQSEGKQLDAFVNFIKADASMHKALKNHDWASFARAYNGPGYAANNYDTKIAAEYNKLNR
jgi:LysM repeat protein